MDSVEEKINHPCFNYAAHKHLARIHLPVAPNCNIQCNFCNRIYDCINESRPGVTSRILTPEEAALKYEKIKKSIDNIAIAGFAGPGDPLANFSRVRETARLIRKIDKKVDFCLSTNGLLLNKYAKDIIDTGFSYITITVNSIDNKTGARIYDYILYEDKEYRGKDAAEVLLKNQAEGLEKLVSGGIVCKINTLYLKGINDNQIEEIARFAGQKGAYIMNIKNLIPAKGSKFENLSPASNEEINRIRKRCSKYIKQMYHCRQCRADSIGLLSDDRFSEFY